MAFPNVKARTAGVGVLRLAVAGAMGLLVVPLLAGPSLAADFSNTTAIQAVRLPPPSGCPSPTGCPSEKASPYPSNISVSGLTGTISDVNVTLRGLTYGDAEGGGPPDIDLMVVAPDGKAVMVMSDACGTNADLNPIAAAVDLTFDDAAAASLPADPADPCVTGTYKPIDDDDDGVTLGTAFQTEDGFPSPAPTPPLTTLPLSTFNGISPNGSWSLYMVDDGPSGTSGINGQFAGGWSLSITTAATPSSSTPSSTGPSSTSSTLSTSSTSSTVASSTTSTTRVSGVTATTTRIPVTGGDNGSMALIGAMFLLIGVAVVTLPHRQPWSDRFSRRR